MRQPQEPVQQVKKRRDSVLNTFVQSVPFLKFMGISFERRGDELTAVLEYDPKLIGNAVINRLHGGGTSGFLESTAVITLAWKTIWDSMEAGELDLEHLNHSSLPPLPKTINFTTDYLRPGLPRDAYARATIVRAGRRYASVHIEAWQDNRDILFAQASGHFLMQAVKQ
ncbi:thioesterase [Amylibacter marinus]|uniref:Thioesterase n=1 Tax=Amylibacter marinus TaxID=1475483 RepID=A0ABQ5VVQ7_9RHOB|nr:PaaI family thioesterase [Amylibacter marinus]GLQ35249.1 thioesterase [Amylibacter marinus]